MANLAAWILLLGLLYNQLTDFDVKSDNPIPPCYDAYNPPPSSSTHRLTAYNADTHLYKDAIPKLGMGHITLAGTRHHGLLNFEVWLQSLAPGVSTPIHSHPAPCEEINYVLEGKGIARTVDKDGRVVDIEIGVNSTVIAPPETIWQVIYIQCFVCVCLLYCVCLNYVVCLNHCVGIHC